MNFGRLATRLRKPEWLMAFLMLVLSVLFMWHLLIAPEGRGPNGGDILGQTYPRMNYIRERLAEGNIPFWDPYTFSGYPFLANSQLEFFYPPMWLALILPISVGLSLYMVIHIWLAGYGMIIFLRHTGSGWVGALLGGLTFAFSGFTSARIGGGHYTLFAACAWTPWILIAFQEALKKRSIWAMIAAGLPFGMAVLTGHTVTLLYVGMIWGVFAIYLVFQKVPLKSVLLGFVVVAATGLILCGIVLIPTLELLAHSARASGDTFQEWGLLWMLPPSQLVTLLNPDFYGNPHWLGYWGVDNFAELTFYVGAPPLLVLPLALRKPTRRTWWYVGMGLAGLVLAMGAFTFIYSLFYDLIPLMHILRSPGRAGFLFVFAASALLADTVTTWEALPAEERRSQVSKIMRTTLIIVFVAGTIALITTQAVYTLNRDAEHAIQLVTQSNGWAWALVVFLAGGALLWQYLSVQPDSLRNRWKLGASIAVLIIFDLWSLGFHTLKTQPFAPVAFWADTQAYLGPGMKRVVPLITDLPFNQENHSILTHVYSVYGYNSLELKNYATLTSNPTQLRSKVFDILSAEYALTVTRLGKKLTTGSNGMTLVADTDALRIYKRPNALPVARLVYKVEVIQGAEQTLQRIQEESFEPKSVAILQESPGCPLGPGPIEPAQAAVVEHSPEYWKIETDSPAPGLLVVSEVIYPGWQVMVDGQKAQPLTAYAALKAVCVPAGRHQVEWVFRPTIYLIGGVVTLLGVILVGAALFKTRALPSGISGLPE